MAQLKDTVISGGLRVTNGTYLSNILNVTGATTLSSTLDVTGATTLSSTLTVNNTSTLKKNVTIGATGTGNGANLTVYGATSITGITSITNDTPSTIYTNGALIVSGGVGIAKAIYGNGTLNITGKTTLSNELEVENKSTLRGNVDIGTSSVASNLLVYGTSTLKKTVIIGEDSSGKTADLTVNGKISITDDTAGTKTTVNNTTTITGALQIDGGIYTGAGSYFTGSVSISGAATADPLIVRGISGCGSDGHRGNTDATKELHLNANGGNVQLGTSGANGYDANLIVNGTTNLNKATTIGLSGSNANLTVNGNTSITGTLDVTSATTLSSTLNVAGKTTIGTSATNANLEVNGNSEITKTLTLSSTTGASATAANTVALVVGGAQTAAHLELDANSIMAKTTGTTVATLNINEGGGNIVLGTNTTTYNVNIKSTKGSNDTTSGALVVGGGVGIAGAVNTNSTLTVAGATTLSSTLDITGVTTISNNTGSTSSSTGALRVTGGIYTGAASYLSGQVHVYGGTDSSSSTTGALKVTGGLGVSKAVNIGTTLGVTGATTLSSTLDVTGNTTIAGVTSITNNTGGGTNSGALKVTGGVYIGEKLYIAQSGYAGSHFVAGTTTSSDVDTHRVYIRSNSGEISLYSAGNANSNGDRGLYAPSPVSGGTNKTIIKVDHDNNITYTSGTFSGQVNINVGGSSVDITQSNNAAATNGMSSNTNRQIQFTDTNSNYIARMYGRADTSGDCNLKLQAGNWYDSAQQCKGLTITLKKNGICSNTFDGNVLIVTNSGPRLYFCDPDRSTSSSNRMGMLGLSSDGTTYGLYSFGYWTGSAFIENTTWMLYRDSTGAIVFNGNANTATTLQTAREIWGRSFDGSAALVSGPIFNRTATGAFWTVRQNDVTCGHMDIQTLGPAGTEGRATLYLGNSLATSAANNASGRIYLYNGSGVSDHTSSRIQASYGDLLSNNVEREYVAINSWVNVSALLGATWNDYAEFRAGTIIKGGYCVCECEDGIMRPTTERLQAGCKVTSDTFGFAIGKTEKCKTPIAVSGRALVYPTRARNEYKLGAAVCSGPDGTVDIMTRDEIMMYPERIVGTVSEIPTYEIWQCNDDEHPEEVQVNGRIWIYVK